MKKKILGILLCMALILTAFYNPLMTKATGETTLTEKSKIESYRSSGTYPTQDGYVFAGWYKDEACTDPVTGTIPEAGAYPKFVDADVLTFKGQLSANVTAGSTNTGLRLITAVDSEMYQKVGFQLKKGEQTADLSSTTVYRTLYGYVDSTQTSYAASDVFGTAEARYFMTKAIANIPDTDFSTSFTVTPYWVTPDGTKVTGTARTFAIQDVIPVTLNVTLDYAGDGTKAAVSELLTIEVSENLSTQLIINGDDTNAKEIALTEADGSYKAWVYMTDIINDLKPGENTFTLRVTKEANSGEKYITEKTVTYNNTGFLYVRDAKGTLETAMDDGEAVLKYSETTGGDWTGFGSSFISYGNNVQGGFAMKGVKYMTMDVKLVGGTGLNIFYDCPTAEAANKVSTTIVAGSTSTYLENRGVQGTLKTDEWITVKIPLNATAADAPYRNFTMQPVGDGAVLYIKNVKYEKSEYIAPLTIFKAIYESGNTNLGNIRIDASENVPIEIVVNGDESKTFSAALSTNPDTSAGAGKYAVWYGMQNLVNAMKLGNNTLTIRAIKTGTNGTDKLVAETDLTYTNTAFLYVYDSQHALELVTDEETGESILKFTETGATSTVWNGVRSNYIAYNNQNTGRYGKDGITYVSMEVKLTTAEGIMVSYEGPSGDTAGNVWRSLNIDAVSDIIDDNGVRGTLELDKWITIKIPLVTNGTTGWRNFYVKPKGNNGVMYIRNVQYGTDTYAAPLEKLTATVEKEAGSEWLIVNTSTTGNAEIIINGDESNPYPITLGTAGVDNWIRIGVDTFLNQLKTGDNVLTVRVPNGTSTAETTVHYENTGYLYVMSENGNLEIIEDGGEQVLKYSGATTKWNGVRSKYVTKQGSESSGTPGNFITAGIKYVSMKVKLQDATGLYINLDMGTNNTAGKIDTEILVGNTSEYLADNGTLKLNEWVTLKVPFNGSDVSWANFYVTTRGDEGTSPVIYIKDVKYETVETSPDF